MKFVLLLIILLQGCTVMHWERKDDGKMELKSVLISTGPAKSGDVETKSAFPDILLPRP